MGNDKVYKNYLYAAAIQGIQGFIMQTDELKDIVGASELIEDISKKAFEEFQETKSKEDENIVLMAAGNIKYVFTDRDKCEKAVLEFPKKVMELVPGITVSQAVVEYKDDSEFGDAIDEIEEKLKAQRNKQVGTHPVFMSMQRSRQTGLPAVKIEKGEFLDAQTVAKRASAKKGSKSSTISLSRKCFGIDEKDKSFNHEHIAYDIEKITDKNDWIAVIHADGNGLGQVVQKVGKNKELFRKFSLGLDKATTAAAVKAFDFVNEKYSLFNSDAKENSIIPIRPIVLGGDDFTVICRADFAIEYTEQFLKAFEKETEKELGDILKGNSVFNDNVNKLTACAGVAFIKSSYPFHYGNSLADSLCGEAKEDAKKGISKNGIAPSSLMFHKVQDSFIEDYKDIKDRELTTDDNVSFSYGPYYIHSKENRSTVEELIEKSNLLDGKEANAVKSHLREWLADMMQNKDMAEQRLLRLKSNLANGSGNKKLLDLVKEITEVVDGRVAAYDVLSLHSIIYKETKEGKK